jgi:hypothetical protein
LREVVAPLERKKPIVCPWVNLLRKKINLYVYFLFINNDLEVDVNMIIVIYLRHIETNGI